MGKFIRGQPNLGNGTGELGAIAKSSFAKEYPALFDYMSETKLPTGGKRETTTILLFVEQGFLKACINDRAYGCVSFVSGEELEALLRSVEERLATDTMEWRVSGSRGRAKK